MPLHEPTNTPDPRKGQGPRQALMPMAGAERQASHTEWKRPLLTQMPGCTHVRGREEARGKRGDQGSELGGGRAREGKGAPRAKAGHSREAGRGASVAEKVRHPLLLPSLPLTFGETKAGRPRGDSSPAIGSTGAVCRLPTYSHLSRAAPFRGPCRCPWPLEAPRGLGTTRHSQVVPVHQTLTVPSSVPGVCWASLHAKGSTSRP